jgi:phosphate transport system substrate-binding protein
VAFSVINRSTVSAGATVIGAAAAFAVALVLACGPKPPAGEAPRTIKISGAYALYPMMTVWAEEYQKLHAGVKIEVSGGGAGKGMADVLGGLVDVAMVSRDIRPEEVARGAFYVSVTKDAVVATMNAANPAAAALASRGVTRAQLEKTFVTREVKTWRALAGAAAPPDAIQVYTRADACGAAETWAKYLGDYNQEDLTKAADAGIMNDPDLAAAVMNDTFALGYNNINFAYDVKTARPLAGIRAVPLDLDGDGKLSADEDFYGDQNELLAAIADGRYPSPPARDLHLVAKDSFNDASRDFVLWILTDGQKLVADHGYIPLPPAKIQAQLHKLEAAK